MNDQQINEAIAKVCGWHLFKRAQEPGSSIWEIRRNDVVIYGFHWLDASRDPMLGDVSYGFIPNYVGSLDAMYEAEEVLWKKGLAYDYDVQLEQTLTDNPYSWSATARQRAEAFLRTLNLWEETAR